VPLPKKRSTLVRLIRSRDMRQVLVFVRMKRDANRLARQLQQDGIAAKEIHSDRTQAERMQALEDFKQGNCPVLVATDIAARGIDIEQLPFVINYELPHTPEDYVHRIGRTGRAGLPGEAISLVSPEEMKFLDDIERLLNRKLPRADAPQMRAEDRHAPRSREHRHERHDHGGRRDRPHVPAPARPQPAASGFDFSKPYEPTGPAPAGGKEAPAPLPRDRHHRRPTAALLGGLPSKHDKK
jgi:ATP-dependent RNA helicase RhlE